MAPPLSDAENRLKAIADKNRRQGIMLIVLLIIAGIIGLLGTIVSRPDNFLLSVIMFLTYSFGGFIIVRFFYIYLVFLLFPFWRQFSFTETELTAEELLLQSINNAREDLRKGNNRTYRENIIQSIEILNQLIEKLEVGVPYAAALRQDLIALSRFMKNSILSAMDRQVDKDKLDNVFSLLLVSANEGKFNLNYDAYRKPQEIGEQVLVLQEGSIINRTKQLLDQHTWLKRLILLLFHLISFAILVLVLLCLSILFLLVPLKLVAIDKLADSATTIIGVAGLCVAIVNQVYSRLVPIQLK